MSFAGLHTDAHTSVYKPLNTHIHMDTYTKMKVKCLQHGYLNIG